MKEAKAGGTTLLGFNEPDMAGQANMSVEQALALWPRLQATGMRLGAPAVAFGADRPGGWLDRYAWFTLSTKTSPTGLYTGANANASGAAYRDAA
ncbi:glycosyl hydrolase [Actinoallomurus sp. NPDC050550]|uniref:glycosyl hydrolase n=1 Tax=Actinoallomurus sp. NPDC050550 TaxID=3154937 RepID=UPI0033D98A5A